MQLKTEKARTIGYSLFFGLLISMIPFNNFVTAEIIDAFNFNVVYKCAMFSYLPGLGLILLIMNDIRLTTRFPLYQLDWASFIFYAVIVTLIGYIMVYGQEYYWLDDPRIYYSCIAIFVLSILFLLRQLKLKRPYFQMDVFKYKNFWLGSLLLLIFYICRFAFGINTSFFQVVLKLDPIHIGYITLFNIAGIIIGVFLSCVYVLQHRPIRLLWIYGFSLLLIYHFWLIFLFVPEVNETEFFIPIFLQGLGAGTLMTPIIIFIINSVPERFSISASGICLFMRCFGFFLSIALINFFDLFYKSKHFDTFMAQTSKASPVLNTMVQKIQTKLISHGTMPDLTSKASNKLLLETVRIQNQIRYSIDYYEMICVMLVFTLILVSLFPYINRTYLTLRKKQTPF